MPIPGGPRPRHVQPVALGQVAALLGLPLEAAATDIPITGVSLSSASVQPGDCYAALPGQRRHGAQFADQARQAGARAIVTDAAGAQQISGSDIPVLVVPQPREHLGQIASLVYANPAADMKMLGITGTNGKTTTCFLLDEALRASGYHAGMIGTIEIRTGDKKIPATGTTPEAPDLQALLAVMREAHVDACAMEVSSHALALHRIDGITFDVAGFTNLSQDHLDFHPTMEDYYLAKARLFTARYARQAVICVDDPWGARLAEETPLPAVRVSTLRGGTAGTADWQVRDETTVAGLPQVLLDTPHGQLSVRSPLPGHFNVANAVVAVAMLTCLGIEPQQAAAAIGAAAQVPGRMQQVAVPTTAGCPMVVVDFAHTPDAVELALSALRPAGNRLVVVLGAGGDRDRGKREQMGAAAAKNADVVIVTDDNPRSEDPASIRAAVVAGARQAGRSTDVREVADRQQAIGAAIAAAWTDSAAHPGVVLIAGKGHEKGQEIDGQIYPFDDVAVAQAVVHQCEIEKVGS